MRRELFLLNPKEQEAEDRWVAAAAAKTSRELATQVAAERAQAQRNEEVYGRRPWALRRLRPAGHPALESRGPVVEEESWTDKMTRARRWREEGRDADSTAR